MYPAGEVARIHQPHNFRGDGNGNSFHFVDSTRRQQFTMNWHRQQLSYVVRTRGEFLWMPTTKISNQGPIAWYTMWKNRPDYDNAGELAPKMKRHRILFILCSLGCHIYGLVEGCGPAISLVISPSIVIQPYFIISANQNSLSFWTRHWPVICKNGHTFLNGVISFNPLTSGFMT